MNKFLTPNYNSAKYIHVVFSIWRHLGKSRRIQTLLIALFILFDGFLEIISLAAVIPFLSILTNPYDFKGSQIFNPLIKFFDITETRDLVILISLCFCFVIFLSGSIKILNVWISTKLAAKMAVDFSNKCFKNLLFQDYTYFFKANFLTC